jgi:HK97 family phage major capsid protein
MGKSRFEVRKDLFRPPQADYYLQAIRELLTGEARHNLPAGMQRALTLAAETTGGFLAAPTEMADRLVGVVTDRCFIRQLVGSGGNVFPVNKAQGFLAPTVTGNPNDSDWTPEINTINTDMGMTFGSHLFVPHPVTKGVIVSNKLLRSSAIPAEEIVIDRVGYKHAIAEEKAFLLGTGAQQPLGVFVASNDGIPTMSDIQTLGGNTTFVDLDTLIAAKFSLKAQYLQNASWVMNRTVLKQISQLKTGDGYPITAGNLFVPKSSPDGADYLLGHPVYLSEYAPSVMTAGQYVAILGDFGQGYVIVDNVSMEIKILTELYALNSNTGIIVRRETDGAPVLAEAFVRIQLATS